MNLATTSSVRARARVAWGPASVVLATVVVTACATAPLVDAQWSDPAFVGRSQVGTKVFVVCDAPDITLKRVCEERFGDEVIASGATPVKPPDATAPGAVPVAPNDRGASAARAAGATTALLVKVAPGVTAVDPGPQVGIGIGGFSGGWRGGTSVGTGITLPIGKPEVQTGYTASATLSDAKSGALIWTGRTGAPPSQDAGAQFAQLARTLLDAAKQARVF